MIDITRNGRIAAAVPSEDFLVASDFDRRPGTSSTHWWVADAWTLAPTSRRAGVTPVHAVPAAREAA